MVFLLKLKHREEELEIAHRQQTELKKQVEVQQGNWLEEASAEIEDAVKSSLIRAEACESQVQMVQKQQEGFVREWQEKLETTTLNLSCITAAKEKLEERVHTMENERVSLVQRVDSETSKRQELEAEIRILLNNVKKSTNEFAEKQSRYLSALEEIKVIKRDLQLQEEDINNLVVDLQDSCSQLETQRAINSSLMRKKEEMEWQCLEAQAEREKLRKQLKGLIGN
ncbi:hypothetical protein O6H91_Y469800 [Diphasiastrum complanatum]|nr:hypothetical protein O6H91_Y469800 [Diphasiastrum complanatum]